MILPNDKIRSENRVNSLLVFIFNDFLISDPIDASISGCFGYRQNAISSSINAISK
jgi:hypothetical protein